MKAALNTEQMLHTSSRLYSTTDAAAGDGPILIASDASTLAALAMTTGRMLSKATGLHVQVFSVIEPVSSLAPAPMLIGLPVGIDEARIGERLDDVREQRRAAGGDASWSIEVRLGEAAPMIARVAKERAARLIVMGLNHHGRVDRVFGGDTVFDVVRLGETPVLVASEPLNRQPRVIVVGVDFSELSTRAAQLAVNIFPAATDVYLVHVAPSIDVTIDGWHDLEYARVARDGFAEVVRSLDGCTARVHTVELTGRRERELARFARGLKADVLVVGSYRRGLFRRLASGTVAARVLRNAPCPVLIVPEPAPGVVRVPAQRNGAALEDGGNAGRRLEAEYRAPCSRGGGQSLHWGAVARL